MSESAPGSVTPTAVTARLDRVSDPELDRSIVELDYVEDVRIEPPAVVVRFKLPTAWCSPTFAWMMATGIRDEVGTLPGVEDVQVQLLDHMHGEQINHGVNENRAFEDVFEDAADSVSEVRETLDSKARLARQYHAVEALLDAGVSGPQITTLTRDAVEVSSDLAVVYLEDEAFAVTVDAEPLREYLQKARTTGVVRESADRLFADPQGEPIDPDDFETVHRRGRLAKVNMGGQGGVCAQLHESRNG